MACNNHRKWHVAIACNNLLIFLNIKLSKLLLFGCDVISDLLLLQEIVLLNPCFVFFKNLIYSLIDKVTTGAKSLALLI